MGSACSTRVNECQGAVEAILKAYGLYQNNCEIYRALCEILPAAGMTAPLEPLPQPLSYQQRGVSGEGGKVTFASILEEMLERDRCLKKKSEIAISKGAKNSAF